MRRIILSIESSCDDTSAAVLEDLEVKSNIVSSQMAHETYGGVVPEVASRAHSEYIWPVVEAALQEANVSLADLSAIACTRGPGLLGSLLVGFTFARSLAYSLRIPLIDVHHMQAHVLAHFLQDPQPILPYLCLTVSGGHTQIVKVKSPLDMEVLGKTIDDAAGEAFDKGGKLLGLKYPAGPEIDRLARDGSSVFTFSKPNIPHLDYSFSGLKTSFLYFLKKEIKRNPQFIEENKSDLCASLQSTIVEILLEKLISAAVEHKIRDIAIAGGVAANSFLRASLAETASKHNWNIYIPKLSYCTDNAAMIGAAAFFKYQSGIFCPLDAKPDARLPWNPPSK